MPEVALERRIDMMVLGNASWTRVAGLFAVAAILSGALMFCAAMAQEEKAAANPLTPSAGFGHKASYYVNGEIHVNELGARGREAAHHGPYGLQTVLVKDRQPARLLSQIER
jgi:hypothetical protein